jgi:hypothetical protein
LVERADQAMYDAKFNGRNRVCMHADTVSSDASRNQRLHVVEKREHDN